MELEERLKRHIRLNEYLVKLLLWQHGERNGCYRELKVDRMAIESLAEQDPLYVVHVGDTGDVIFRLGEGEFPKHSRAVEEIPEVFGF